MFLIGIAGGVSSGKSAIARCFEKRGARILDADKLGHQVLKQPEVVRSIAAIWGNSIIDESGEINRQSLAELVFDPENGPDHLGQLEAITHPRITDLLQDELRKIQSDHPNAVVILDAPLMFKAGWDILCHKIVFVDTPIEIRKARAQSRGWSAEELENRERRQLSISQKRDRSNAIVDNSGSLELTCKQVDSLWNRWSLPLSDEDTESQASS
ncbi:MAG: dephospho-CoA kinase [Planctomycetota bacterium]